LDEKRRYAWKALPWIVILRGVAEENVEIVRQVYKLFNDTAELDPATYDPDFEYRDTVDSPVPLRRGFEGFQAWARDVHDAFDDFRLEPRELIELPGERVLALIVVTGRGRGSDAPIEVPIGVIWTLRGGRILRCERFLDEASARAAAGLSE
jgi:ketosteroid isomerase-like protein